MISVILYILSSSVLNINFYTKNKLKEKQSSNQGENSPEPHHICAALPGWILCERVGHRVPGVVVYLTFTLMYGGIITHSFITCKLHLKQSGKVRQPVL